jgi:hypothetical protein
VQKKLSDPKIISDEANKRHNFTQISEKAQNTTTEIKPVRSRPQTTKAS